MGFWWWVLVFGGIAVLALAVFVLLALRLWRKAKVLLGELGRLSSVMSTLETAFGSAEPDELFEREDPFATVGKHRAG